jgi:hypothetical protein
MQVHFDGVFHDGDGYEWPITQEVVCILLDILRIRVLNHVTNRSQRPFAALLLVTRGWAPVGFSLSTVGTIAGSERECACR